MTNFHRTWDDLSKAERGFYPPEIKRAVEAIRALAEVLDAEDPTGDGGTRFAGLGRALDGEAACIAEWRAQKADPTFVPPICGAE